MRGQVGEEGVRPSEILGRAYESALAADGGYVVLLGDLMVDIWLEGQVDRQSPEDARVPVFLIRDQSVSLGGAGCVYRHLKAMGVPKVKFLARTGKDEAFTKVAELLGEASGGDKDSVFLLADEDGRTTTKLRAYDQHGKQRIRVDSEDISPMDGKAEGAVIEALKQYVGQQCRLVLVSDYNKGFVTPAVMDVVRDLCWRRRKKFLVDPAKRKPEVYARAWAMTPNEAEYEHMLHTLERPARNLLESIGCDYCCTTLGHDGLALTCWDPFEVRTYNPWPVKVRDVIGAGDAVFAGLALMLCGKEPAPMALAAQFANMLGGWSVSQLHTMSPTRADIEQLIEKADGWVIWPEEGQDGRRTEDLQAEGTDGG